MEKHSRNTLIIIIIIIIIITNEINECNTLFVLICKQKVLCDRQ